MKCPKCGYMLPEDSDFCQYCGVNIAEEQRAQAAARAAAEAEQVAKNQEYYGIVKDNAATEQEPESLFLQAYNSYISSTPAGQQLFDALIGGEALKAAYQKECEKRAQLHEAGIRVNYKDSYLEFMSILHKEYSSAIPTPKNHNTAMQPTNFSASATHVVQTSVKPSKRAAAIIPIIVLSFLLVASLAVNAFLYFNTITVQALKIKEMEDAATERLNTISTLEKTITTKQNLITSQKNEISSLTKKGNYFDTICSELRSGNVGYVANNFKSDESVIVVKKSETNRKFTLTANWTNGGTVTVKYSGSSARLNFDSESWTTSTTMTVSPLAEGVTVATFTNDVDSKTFKVLIIVIN